MILRSFRFIVRRSRRLHIRRHWYFLYQRTKAGLKARHESSLLGMIWYLLSPALMFLILMVVFSQRLGASIEYYILYLLLGLVLWDFFSAGTSCCLGALMGQAGLIKSMPVRADVLVLSSLLDTLVNHIFELSIFLLLALYYDVLSAVSLLFPLIIGLQFLFVLGMCYLLSALFFYFRDVNQIWSVLIRVWWFATPIFYQLTETGPGKKINMFNPMFHVIDSARSVLIYQRMPDTLSILILAFSAVLMFVCGYFVFRKLSPRFPEFV